MPCGREEVPWSVMTQVLILGRLLDPSSELHLAEHGYEASALAELLGVPAAKVNDDRLYRTLDRLLPHKPVLEKHLKQRLGELFDLDYDLLLYDVTSTYFEGMAAANPQAQRGYSRDHRPDCKQVNIALGGQPQRAASWLRGICRQSQRCDHGQGDRRSDGEQVRPGQADLGDGSRDGFCRQRGVPAARWSALYPRYAQEHVAQV